MKQYIYITTMIVLTSSAIAQTSVIGGKDYGLAASSAMWIPRGSALFLNPSELGRIHQDEFLFNTSRFRNMSSMAGTYSLPFIGTTAGGIANVDTLTYYSLGFGKVIGNYHTIGTSVTIISPIQDGFRFAFGGALHFPFSVQNSGIHFGIAASNLPKETMLNGGVALWVVPDWFRIQAAAQNRTYRAMIYGAEVVVSDNFSLLAGSRAFKSIYGGLSYSTSTFTTDFTAGPQGIAFSLNIIIGEPAEDNRSIAYEDGYNLYSEKRYYESIQKFLVALDYDEYDDDSRTMSENASILMDSVEVTNIALAKELEDKQRFPEAIDAYSAIIRANPTNIMAETLLVESQRKFRTFIELLISVGDSLKSRKQVDNARKNYELALKYDSSNAIASARLDELQNLSKENVKNVLVRAQSFLDKMQLDNAEKEYERALSLEPKNSRARAGLNTIKDKRKDELFENAKTIYDEGKYFDALVMMLDLVKQNIKNKDLQTYIELARKKLQPEVEKRFKIGLSYYASENYDHAITVWDNALLIQPRHTGLLEYRKRAEEKMKALEQLK